MGINNIDTHTLETVFSITKIKESGAWGVKLTTAHESVLKKGFDLAVGGLRLDINKKQHSSSRSTTVFSEDNLADHITYLQKHSSVTDPAPYIAALAALRAFLPADSDNDVEVLRQMTMVDVEGNVLSGRKAVLRTVETKADGSQSTLARAFDKANLTRYAYQTQKAGGEFWTSSFYQGALGKIGGTTSGKSVSELLKPATWTTR